MESDEEEMKPLKRTKKKSQTPVNTKGPVSKKTQLKGEKTQVPLKGYSESKQMLVSALTCSTRKEEMFCSVNNKAVLPFFHVHDNPSPQHKSGLCPVCNIDMNFLHGASPQAHINQCLDANPEFEQGYCSGDSNCSLSNVNHFRKFKHSPKKLKSKANIATEVFMCTSSGSETEIQQTHQAECSDSQSSSILNAESLNGIGKKNNEGTVDSKKDNANFISTKQIQLSSDSCTKNMLHTQGVHDSGVSCNEGAEKSIKNLKQTSISNLFLTTKSKSGTQTKQPIDAIQLKQSTVTKKKLLLQDTNDPSQNFVTKNTKPPVSKPVASKKKKEQPRKECPFYKKIPGTGITVDAFRYGDIPGCTAYFLSHFHSDHYGGLTKHFTGQLYCSQITANLVTSHLYVDARHVTMLPMYKKVIVGEVQVTLLDANHCPGSVMFLLDMKTGQCILHVGDFRADISMLSNMLLQEKRIGALYLDTTYCDPKYTFPSQKEVIDYVLKTSERYINENPRTLIVCGTYTIGKERVFLPVAKELNSKIGVSKAKMKVLSCLEDNEIKKMLTLDYTEANLHVIPLGNVNLKKLREHFSKFKHCGYDRLLAFKPTGWTFSNNIASVNDIKPITDGNIYIYGVPYSEHSSYSELKWFVETLKPRKIIPTVNIGSKKSRDAMNEHFKMWLQ